ncbi:MAG: FecR domain-containing protein, partial [Verrucomicrobiota bacterium]
MIQPRAEELIQKYVIGILSESEAQELTNLLSRDDAQEERRRLRLALRADVYLQEASAEEGHLQEPTTEPTRSLSWAWIGTAAALLLALLAWVRPPSTDQIGLAQVIRIEGPTNSFSEGTHLPAGREIQLDQGFIELAFLESGVHLVGSAPLSLRLDSAKRVFLHRGEIKLVVPPQGIGFVVDTEQRRFRDLGTSFVVTAKSQASQVLVLDGQISVEDGNQGEGHLMGEGEMGDFHHDGQILHQRSKRPSGVPELPLASMVPGAQSLSGRLLAYSHVVDASGGDVIGSHLLPFVQSRFREDKLPSELVIHTPLRFTG